MIRIYTCISFILAVALAPSSLFSQQELLLSNATLRNVHLNPSKVGLWLDKETSFSADITYRSQWIGFEGAPSSLVLNLEGLLENYNLGLGLTLIQDKIGIENKYEIAGNYAYQIRFENGTLAMGLRTGLTFFNTQFENLSNSADYDLNELDPNFVNYSIGLGATYIDEHVRIAVGVPSVYAFTQGDSYDFKQQHFYLESSFKIGDYYNSRFIFEPLIQVRLHKSTPIQTNIGLIFWLNEYLFPSFQYRLGESVIFGVGTRFAEKVTASLSYDLVLNQLRTNTAGSLELNVNYSF